MCVRVRCVVSGFVVAGVIKSPACCYSATPMSRWRWRARWPQSSRCPPSRLCLSSPCTGRWTSRPRWTDRLPLRHSPPDCHRFPSRCHPATSGCPAEACCPRRCCKGKTVNELDVKTQEGKLLKVEVRNIFSPSARVSQAQESERLRALQVKKWC